MRATLDRPDAVLYRDRAHAGRELARALAAHRPHAVVIGIPRGGVVVAAEVARALDDDLEVIVARKIGAPGQDELAIGAVTADGTTFLNDELIRMLGVSDPYVSAVIQTRWVEARERDRLLRGDAPPLPLRGRTVILVDDGLATGATMHAAVRAVRHQQAARIIVAAPVGSGEACGALRLEADEVICPDELTDFGSVGLYYQRFEQVHDEEVARLLQESRARVRRERP